METVVSTGLPEGAGGGSLCLKPPCSVLVSERSEGAAGEMLALVATTVGASMSKSSEMVGEGFGAVGGDEGAVSAPPYSMAVPGRAGAVAGSEPGGEPEVAPISEGAPASKSGAVDTGATGASTMVEA